eukprot:7381494-Prymnesium_polylepis.3
MAMPSTTSNESRGWEAHATTAPSPRPESASSLYFETAVPPRSRRIDISTTKSGPQSSNTCEQVRWRVNS